MARAAHPLHGLELGNQTHSDTRGAEISLHDIGSTDSRGIV